MIIYPAIDLMGGKCVRLYQGDYQQKTTYSFNPQSVVDFFVSEGATWLHLVDLDGAKNSEKNQESQILSLLKQQSLSIQIGGGVRCVKTIETYLNEGAARVIIGSLAVSSPELVLTWFQRFGAERLVIALDVVYDNENNPFVATNAWQKISNLRPESLIETYQAAGLKHILCTDISKDGTLKGPNIGLYESLASQFPALKIQASGGIQALSDLKLLKDKGCNGAIIGRALYENKFSLSEALLC